MLMERVSLNGLTVLGGVSAGCGLSFYAEVMLRIARVHATPMSMLRILFFISKRRIEIF